MINTQSTTNMVNRSSNILLKQASRIYLQFTIQLYVEMVVSDWLIDVSATFNYRSKQAFFKH